MNKKFIRLLASFVVIYAIVWILFIIDGPLPTGNGLNKSDWLSFLSSAIGGGITIVLGGVVYWQNLRLEKYSEEANKIAKKQLQIEANQNRPYFRIYKNSFKLAISKATYGFSEEYQSNLDYDLKYGGNLPFDENNLNSCYPPAINLLFDIENTGSVEASSIHITRLLIMDGATGVVKGFTSNFDTSTIFQKKNRLLIEVNQQICFDNIDKEDIEACNKIAKHYSNSEEEHLNLGFIELRLTYKDVFDEEYFQEYSIHYGYELSKESSSEYIFDMKNVEVQHHNGLSPYGPRLDEE